MTTDQHQPANRDGSAVSGSAASVAVPAIGTPGKIIAVHLSYTSRAQQRGRRPAQPSYFFKPSSSVAATGGTVERPLGTELLAFEGEGALVIGTPAVSYTHLTLPTKA